MRDINQNNGEFKENLRGVAGNKKKEKEKTKKKRRK